MQQQCVALEKGLQAVAEASNDALQRVTRVEADMQLRLDELRELGPPAERARASALVVRRLSSPSPAARGRPPAHRTARAPARACATRVRMRGRARAAPHP